MANLSGPQLAQLAIQAGFPQSEAQTAAAVALAESSGNPNARNPSGAAGLWQILQSAHPELFRQYVWNDPAQNAKMAYIVWTQAGNSWRPWTTYTSGRYKLFLGQVGAVSGSGVTAGATAGGALGDPAATAAAQAQAANAQSVTDFVTAASDPTFWTRVAMFLAGVFLMGAALHGLLSHSSAYRNIAGSAKTALKVAAL